MSFYFDFGPIPYGFRPSPWDGLPTPFLFYSVSFLASTVMALILLLSPTMPLLLLSSFLLQSVLRCNSLGVSSYLSHKSQANSLLELCSSNPSHDYGANSLSDVIWAHKPGSTKPIVSHLETGSTTTANHCIQHKPFTLCSSQLLSSS